MMTPELKAFRHYKKNAWLYLSRLTEFDPDISEVYKEIAGIFGANINELIKICEESHRRAVNRSLGNPKKGKIMQTLNTKDLIENVKMVRNTIAAEANEVTEKQHKAERKALAEKILAASVASGNMPTHQSRVNWAYDLAETFLQYEYPEE